MARVRRSKSSDDLELTVAAAREHHAHRSLRRVETLAALRVSTGSPRRARADGADDEVHLGVLKMGYLLTGSSKWERTGEVFGSQKVRFVVPPPSGEISPVASDFAMYFNRTTSAFQRYKNEQERCSYGRDPGRRRRCASTRAGAARRA
mmetsp:Transcript_4264/g.12856  ORF Transcript_4264/g.12856 Transcript_4264/m.12856 type:complete len:149 (-) Transcript_4264:519-965(-)